MTYTRHPISAVLTDKEGYVIDSTTPISVTLDGTTISVDPAESGAVSFAYGHTSIINASATLIVAARATRRAVLITNTHATATCYVGDASVATSTGQAVTPGSSLTLPVIAAVYGIGSASLTATFIEIWD